MGKSEEIARLKLENSLLKYKLGLYYVYDELVEILDSIIKLSSVDLIDVNIKASANGSVMLISNNIFNISIWPRIARTHYAIRGVATKNIDSDEYNIVNYDGRTLYTLEELYDELDQY